MNNNRANNTERNREDNSPGVGFWGTIGVIGAAAAAIGTVSYLATRPATEPQQAQNKPAGKQKKPDTPRPGGKPEPNPTSSFISGLFEALNTDQGHTPQRKGVPRKNIPDNPQITNLNSLLSDIYVRYVAINDDEFKIHYRVFDVIFKSLHNTMKKVDAYYNKYSSRVQFAGSHYDNLRIKKPDEFDVDIIIGLPVCIKPDPVNPSDIVLEPKGSGFVQLKMGVQFQQLPKRDREEWLINSTAYYWKDDKHYLRSSNFTDWFKGVVNKALDQHQVNGSGPPLFYVDGVPYTVRRSQSGPAMTIFIENHSRRFKLDVDLVPAFKFPETRWPICKGYRQIPPGCNAKQQMWMVVPKPNKDGLTEQDKKRSWRIAMHDQERGLMFDLDNMKLTIRLMKKLRDSLEMHKIASYYVKTVFFWVAVEAVERNDAAFWRKDPAELFKIMVKRLHAVLVAGNIPYFWNKSNNLIGGVNPTILKGYTAKLAKLLDILDRPSDYKQVAKFLLTAAEFKEYNQKILHI